MSLIDFDSLMQIGAASHRRTFSSVSTRRRFAAALGAARLGMVASGDASVGEVMTAPAISEEIAPDTALTPAFDDAYTRFRAAYGPTREIQ